MRSRLLSFALFILLVVPAGTAFAQEAQPGDACSTADSYRVSGGPENSGTVYTMTCQGGVWVRITESDTSGNLGVKEAAPKAPLDVGGEVKIGTSTGLTCDSDREGAFRWNATDHMPEVCDGSNWVKISIAVNNAALIITPNVQSGMDISTSGTPAYGSYYTFTVENIGNVTSVAMSTALSNTGNFEFGTDNCNGNTLAAGATCTIQVRAKAYADGAYSGILSVAANNTVTASLSGTASGSCGTIGSSTGGGKLAACLSGYELIVQAGGCDGTLHNPSCAGANDTATKQAATIYGYNISGTGASDGLANTRLLVTDTTAGDDHPAADYCAGLTLNGYSDWYLPAQDEFSNYIYPNSGAIGKFVSDYYWTSQNSGIYYTIEINPITGASQIGTSPSTRYVRCVRRAATYAGAHLVWTIPSGADAFSITSSGSPAYSAALTFTLTNTGGATSSTVALGLSNSANFEILNDNCTGNTLAASGGNCTVDVREKATYDGSFFSALAATVDNAPAVPLNGTATNSCGTIGSSGGGGIIASCENGYSLIVMPSNCNDSTTPTCDNSATDTVTKEWSTETVSVGASSDADGQNTVGGNTAKIVTRVATSGAGTYPAGEFCANMNYGGHTDWYLPADSEVETLYYNHVAIGGFAGSQYWTSTEHSSSTADRRAPTNNIAGAPGKSTLYYVRCVRRQ